jgi:hypothetical protein
MTTYFIHGEQNFPSMGDRNKAEVDIDTALNAVTSVQGGYTEAVLLEGWHGLAIAYTSDTFDTIDQLYGPLSQACGFNNADEGWFEQGSSV